MEEEDHTVSRAKDQPGGQGAAEATDESLHRLEIAYADHRDNRMIIIGGAVFDSLAEQDREFDELPAVPDSDFIVDYHDVRGEITKDKCVSQETVETVMDRPIADLIEDGRRNEDELSAEVRRHLALSHQQPHDQIREGEGQ